jgi:hypothetical protein
MVLGGYGIMLAPCLLYAVRKYLTKAISLDAPLSAN